jgi:hypothetical protein
MEECKFKKVYLLKYKKNFFLTLYFFYFFKVPKKTHHGLKKKDGVTSNCIVQKRGIFNNIKDQHLYY